MTRTVIVSLVIAATLAIAAAFSPGCEPTTDYKGRRVTEAQLAEAVSADLAKAEAAGKAAAEAAAAEAAKQAAALEKEARERQRAFERAVTTLVREHNFKLEDLTDLYEQEMGQIADQVAEVQASGEAAVKAAHEAAMANAAAIADAGKAGQADIDGKWNFRETLGSFLAPAIDAGASFVPGLGAVIGVLGGGTGIAGLLGMSRANRRRLSSHEAARAALAAIDMLPPAMREAARQALTAVADRADKAVIEKIQFEDELTPLKLAA